MPVYTMADLHFSSGSDHPMDVFGFRWKDYTEKICKNWKALITDADTVILPGDISWGMTLAESLPDFQLLNSLPGKKLLGKGNHDFWWETAAKMYRFFKEYDLTTLSFLYNNACVVEDFIVCGTRGWFLEEEQQNTVGTVEFTKILNRETQRLKISLEAARSLQKAKENVNKEIIVFLHFPPVFREYICREFTALFAEYGIRRCYYGHIHGMYRLPPVETFESVEYHLISSDYLQFFPKRVFPLEIN